MSAAPFAVLEERLASVTMSRLANVECVANGSPFAAQFNITDRLAFDQVSAGDYSLRYLSADVVLAKGDGVVVTGGAYAGAYVVADAPLRINGQESVVGLVRD